MCWEGVCSPCCGVLGCSREQSHCLVWLWGWQHMYGSPALPLPDTCARPDSCGQALSSWKEPAQSTVQPRVRRASCPARLGLGNVCSGVSPLYEKSLNLHFHMCGSRAREDPAASPGWECLSSHPCHGADVLEDLLVPYSTVVAGWVLCSCDTPQPAQFFPGCAVCPE